MLEHAKQPRDLAEVAALGAPNRRFGQVVAQHDARVDAAHPRAARRVVVAALGAQTLAVARAPGVESGAVAKQVAQRAMGGVGLMF